VCEAVYLQVADIDFTRRGQSRKLVVTGARDSVLTLRLQQSVLIFK
jgi:hypothetical protein